MAPEQAVRAEIERLDLLQRPQDTSISEVRCCVLEAPPAFEAPCASIVSGTRLFIVSVFRVHYTECVETNLLDDGMGSRAHAHGEVNRVTINTIVQWPRGETHGPIACAWIANEDHEW